MQHIRTVETYRTLPRLAAKLQVTDTPTIVSHVPVMMSFMYEDVPTDSKVFKWDQDKLIAAMNDQTHEGRRAVADPFEKELEARKDEWTSLWDETTIDFSWEFMNGVTTKHAKRCVEAVVHRSPLYANVEKERETLRRKRSDLLAKNYAFVLNGSSSHRVRSCAEVDSLSKQVQICVNQMKQTRKDHRAEVSNALPQDIDMTGKHNNCSLAWRLARSLSQRSVGARKRRFRLVRTARPTMQ